MAKLIFYRKDGACSIAAHMLLLHVKIPFTSIPLAEGPNRFYEGAPGTGLTREAFLKINPMGYVPALVLGEGETVITELTAVLFYISSLAPNHHMTGRSALETARVLSWLSWLSTTMNEYGFAGYWRPSRMVGLEVSPEAEAAVKKQGKKIIVKGFKLIEDWLDESGHAVGGDLTVVDLVLHTFWRWGKGGEFVNQETNPRLHRVALLVEQLPCAQQALKEEGVDFSAS